MVTHTFRHLSHGIKLQRVTQVLSPHQQSNGAGGVGLCRLNQVPVAGHGRDAGSVLWPVTERVTARSLQRAVRTGAPLHLPHARGGERPRPRGGVGTSRPVTSARPPALGAAVGKAEGCPGTGHRGPCGWQTRGASARPCGMAPSLRPSLLAAPGTGLPAPWPTVCTWGRRELTPPLPRQRLPAWPAGDHAPLLLPSPFPPPPSFWERREAGSSGHTRPAAAHTTPISTEVATPPRKLVAPAVVPGSPVLGHPMHRVSPAPPPPPARSPSHPSSWLTPVPPFALQGPKWGSLSMIHSAEASEPCKWHLMQIEDSPSAPVLPAPP